VKPLPKPGAPGPKRETGTVEVDLNDDVEPEPVASTAQGRGAPGGTPASSGKGEASGAANPRWRNPPPAEKETYPRYDLYREEWADGIRPPGSGRIVLKRSPTGGLIMDPCVYGALKRDHLWRHQLSEDLPPAARDIGIRTGALIHRVNMVNAKSVEPSNLTTELLRDALKNAASPVVTLGAEGLECEEEPFRWTPETARPLGSMATTRHILASAASAQKASAAVLQSGPSGTWRTGCGARQDRGLFSRIP
jgi:hypothetical protein